jgi:hypothetical protein
LAPCVQAANISFGTVTPFTTADAALTAPGNTTLVGAVGIGGGPTGSTTTVTVASQTVNFLSDGSAGSILTITQTGNEGIAPGGPMSPTSNANFNAVMSDFAYDGNPVIGQLTGLTVGRKYEVELFALDDRGCCSGRTVEFGDGNGNDSTVFSLGSNSYVFGTFTADATTQNVESIGFGQPQSNFNAAVLYSVNVPEPASLVALVGLGGMVLIGFAVRRRRRTA